MKYLLFDLATTTASLDKLKATLGDDKAVIKHHQLPKAKKATAVDYYAELTAAIEAAYPEPEMLVIVLHLDSPEESATEATLLEQLQPVGGYESRYTALGMLILAYPELAFIIHQAHDISQAEQPYHVCDFNAPDKAKVRIYLEALRLGLDPLFDCTGLRAGLLKKQNEVYAAARDGSKGVQLPARTALAVAVDEEADYTAFLALSAYRQGFRTLPVSSRRLYDWYLTNRAKLQPAVIVTDLFVNFPDGREPGDKLEEREELRDHTGAAIVVTSGSQNDARATTRNANIKHAESKKWAVLHKPLPGILGFWKHAYEKGPNIKTVLQGEASHWRANKFDPHPNTADTASHSAPGTLLVIAGTLLCRAEAAQERNDLSPVRRAVLSAMLARCAKEVLGGLTPATSLRAVQLMHALEVKVEALFMGVEYDLEFEDRFKEIEIEVQKVCSHFSQNRSHLAELNARMKVLRSMQEVMEAYGEKEESDYTLAKIRSLQTALWKHRRQSRLVPYPFFDAPNFKGRLAENGAFLRDLPAHIWNILLSWARCYIEWLMSNFGIFAAATLGWLAASMVYFWWFYPAANSKEPAVALTSGFLAFFGQSIDADVMTNWWMDAGLVCFGLIGFVHLGVFISHLYSLCLRR